MGFVSSIVMLASIIMAACVPLFFGHGLAAHEPKWFGYAAGCLVVAAVLVFVQRRMIGAGPRHTH